MKQDDRTSEIEALLFRAQCLELVAAMYRFSAATIQATEGIERFTLALAAASGKE